MSQSIIELKEQLSAADLTPHKWGVRKAGSREERQRAADANEVSDASLYSTGKQVIDTNRPDYRKLVNLFGYADRWWKFHSFEYLYGQRLFYRDKRKEIWGEIERLNSQIKDAASVMDDNRADILQWAKDKLGLAYDESAYPTSFRDRFGLSIVEFSLDPPQYLQRDDAEEYQRELARRLTHIEDSQRRFEQEMFGRIATVASQTSINLGKDKVMMPNFTSFAALFDRVATMRFEGTAVFKSVMADARDIIDGVPVEELRKKGGLRKEVKDKLDNLLTKYVQLQEAIKEKANKSVELESPSHEAAPTPEPALSA